MTAIAAELIPKSHGVMLPRPDPRLLELALDEHTWRFLGYDGQALASPTSAEPSSSPPATAPTFACSRWMPVTSPCEPSADRGGMAMMMGAGASVASAETILATVRVTGDATPGAGPAAGSTWGVRPTAEGMDPRATRCSTLDAHSPSPWAWKAVG